MKRLLALALLVLCIGCGETTVAPTSDTLPTGATNVREVGNGWSTFDWQGHHILYHKFNYQNGGQISRSESFCVISMKAEKP